MGGLAAAATLRDIGMDVKIYEQAARFARVGAGIQMMPNSMKVLRRIGIEGSLRETSFKPYSHLNHQWDTGNVLRELPMPEDLFGAPAAPFMVGLMVTSKGIASVFLMFAGVSVVGALVATRMLETENRRLEDIAQ